MSRAFTVVAIIAAYNEADIIELAVRDLIANGILVYLIDDGSTDGTAQRIEPLVGHGVVGVEALPNCEATEGSRTFSLERLVRRKAQIAADLDADWVINHDADEFRESPWAGVPLLEGIRRVDAFGYNAIDFASLDFWLTADSPEPRGDVREALTWYSEAAPYNRVQIRCWKKGPRVDLVSTGGHDVQFEDRRVFPIRFISRHYPIRGQAHGERKVFLERRPRFSANERARNWHVQYDGLQKGASFVRDTCELTRYDGDAIRVSLALRHRGVEALEAAMADSRSTVEAIQRALEAAHGDTQSARHDAARQAGQIAELTAVVERITQDIDAHRQESRQLRAAMDARAIELGETRAQLAHFREAITVRESENAALRAHLEERDRNVVRLLGTIEQRESALAQAREETAVRDRDIALNARELIALRSAYEDARGRLDAVHRSWSWRLSTPGRSLLRWVRGY